MKLYIDTSYNTKTIVGLDEERMERPAGPGKSQQVLLMVEELLAKNSKSLSDISEIEVEVGPGSFTGLRVGVSVANTLAWTLGVPVNGQKMVEPKYEEEK